VPCPAARITAARSVMLGSSNLGDLRLPLL
jgi:hypothetical protein